MMIVAYHEGPFYQTGAIEINGVYYHYAFFNLANNTRYGYWDMAGQIRCRISFPDGAPKL